MQNYAELIWPKPPNSGDKKTVMSAQILRSGRLDSKPRSATCLLTVTLDGTLNPSEPHLFCAVRLAVIIPTPQNLRNSSLSVCGSGSGGRGVWRERT